MVRRRSMALNVSVWRHERRSRWHEFRSAVSLHAHTSYSREALVDLPRYLVQIPFVGSRVERELRTECAIDFSKGWWHPPVTAREVFDSESGQIADRLQLVPIVSLSDHDDLRAGLDVQLVHDSGRAPISFEWTVPYGPGYFHLGVHNLPPAEPSLVRAAIGFLLTTPQPWRIARRPAAVASLLVFNTPGGDLAPRGPRHTSMRHFLRAHGIACTRSS